jgi:hypothetical protein
VENFRFKNLVGIFPHFIQIDPCEIYSMISVLYSINIHKGYHNKLKVFLKYVKLSVIHQKLDDSF